MYRVVIVDDEEPVLDSFAFILSKMGEKFTLAGKARSGTEAVKIISEVKPDIVFMDIQMPGIDGIDAISRLRDQFPEIVFILATAYERFDIAKRAIPLGVFSYLVKPISRKTFVAELERLGVHLDRERQRADSRLEDIRLLNRSKEEVKNKLLTGLAWGSPQEKDWEIFSRLFDLKSDRGTICLVEIREELSAEAQDAAFTRLVHKLQFKFNCFHATLGRRLVLLFAEDQSLDRLDSSLRMVTAELLPAVVAVGKGGTTHYSQLASSFAGALRSLEDTDSREKPASSERDEIQAICTAMLKQDFALGQSLFEEFWIRTFRGDDFDVAKGRMVALFTLLLSRIDAQTQSTARIELDPAESIMRIKSVEEWREWARETVPRLQSLVCEHEVLACSPHLSKALAIIHRSYDRPIQLSAIAEECRITDSYLCRLFSEHLGTTFVEYLTRYRIRRATSLLREEGLSVKETSRRVGFQDPNYFSRIFRRYTGVSPSELAPGGEA